MCPTAPASILPWVSGLPEARDPGVIRRLSPRERRVETAVAALFVVTAGAMLAASSDWDEPLSAVLLTATYVLVDRVSFQLGPGFVSPTQLVFVPMLFLLPAEAVPALVAAGSVLSVLPDIVLRRAHAERAIVAVADSWYAVGAAAVFVAFPPGDPGWSDVGVYALALLAQFAVSAAVSAAREWFGAGIHPRELVPVLEVVCLVDLLLSPIGFMGVLASENHAYAYLLAVPPGGLLALVARERRRRTEHELSLGRAYQRSAEQLSAQAEELRRARLRVGEAIASALDRDGLEQLLLATAVEAVEADCGRLGVRTAGDVARLSGVLAAAEAAVLSQPGPQAATAGDATALAIALVSGELLTVARSGAPFSPAETDLLENLAVQIGVSLDNLRLRELERAAAEAVRELSTPVLAVLERLLIVPLVGAMDASRARQLTDELLRRIRSDRAQVAVIDVTGVPAIDSTVAGQLVGTVEACRLLGTRVIVTGLSSETTQALATIGVDLRSIHAVADLQRGIEEAQRLLGVA
jgi:anti-anti-sigma factor